MSLFSRLRSAWKLIWSRHFVLIVGHPHATGISLEIETIAPRNPIEHQAFFIGSQVLMGHAGAAQPSPVVDPDIEKMLRKVEGV